MSTSTSTSDGGSSDEEEGWQRRKVAKKRVQDSAAVTGWRRQPDFTFFDPRDQEIAERCKASPSEERPPKPQWTISHADYQVLPSYDYVTSISASRPGTIVEFDHHPLIGWEPDSSRWDTIESNEIRVFWESAMTQLESKPEELFFRSRDPFVVCLIHPDLPELMFAPSQDKARFALVKEFLQRRCSVNPDIMDELSAVKEIPDDITLVVWLLNRSMVCQIRSAFKADFNDLRSRHEAAEEHRDAWFKFLLKSVKAISDFFQRPVVELLDDFRVAWPEHVSRSVVSLAQRLYWQS